MIEKSTTQYVFELFLTNPTRSFHLREVSRLLNLSMPTIIRATDALSKSKLITKHKGTLTTVVLANRDNLSFTRLKRLYNLEKIYSSSIIEFLTNLYSHPQAIILFGSFSRGEDIEKSDIDIAVITSRKVNPNLASFEKKLKHQINIIEVTTEHMSDEFKANLTNGIILEGSW